MNKITTIHEFGRYLERLRGDNSARQIAIGICTPVHLRDIERGSRIPSEIILYKLAQKYGVNAKELIFTVKRIIAPDQTKEYYKVPTNNSIPNIKEHADMMKDIDKMKNDIEEIKYMMKELLRKR